MQVLFSSLSRWPESKKASIASVTLGPTMSQKDLKKIPWRPSGPGALRGLIRLRTALLSSLVTLDRRRALSSWEMEGFMCFNKLFM